MGLLVVVVAVSCSEDGTEVDCASEESCDPLPAFLPGGFCPTEAPQGDPASVLEYARRALPPTGVRVGVATALVGAGATLDVRVESYAIVRVGDGTLVVGRDDVGAMYGAFEAAERLDLDGPGALPPSGPITGAPALAVRGYNPYVVMPEAGESCWYFRDASFWQAYLDTMARARMNFLDLHAM